MYLSIYLSIYVYMYMYMYIYIYIYMDRRRRRSGAPLLPRVPPGLRGPLPGEGGSRRRLSYIQYIYIYDII